MNTTSNVDKILAECQRVLKKGLNLPSDSHIKVDCDAYSIIIQLDPYPTEEAKTAVADLLYMFGSPMSEISLPKTAIANRTPGPKSRKDQIFGSDFVVNQEIGKILFESEVILTNTPTKIAIHQSCREKMKTALEQGGYPIDVTNQAGLCFNPNSTFKLPSYGLVVKSLLSGAACVDIQRGEQSFKKTIIHIGNVGTLYPVDRASRRDFSQQCQIHEMFLAIDNARRIQGIQIDVSQLDIAFNIPSHGDKLVQWTCERNSSSMYESVFHKSTEMDTWPIHDIIRLPNKEFPEPNDQKGTVRLRQSHWNTPQTISLFSEDDDELDTSVNNFLVSLYSRPEDNGPNQPTSGQINCKSIFSVKAYSDVAHYMGRTKSSYPLTYKATDRLPSQQVIQIQRQVLSLGELMTAGFQFVSRTDVRGRVEFSIRPNAGHPSSQRVRSVGHFVDFLSHVYIGLHDVFTNGKYTLKMHTDVSYETVAIRCNEIIQSIQKITTFRAQRQFKDVFTSPQMHSWLKAMFCAITTLLGLTHDTKLRPIMDWISPNALSNTHYDPLNIKERIMTGFSILEEVENDGHVGQHDNDTRQFEDMISLTLERCLPNMDSADRQTMMDITKVDFVSSREIYMGLSLQGKFILAEKTADTLIPALAKLIHLNDDDHIDDINTAVVGTGRNELEDTSLTEITDLHELLGDGPNNDNTWDITTWSPHLMCMYIDPEFNPNRNGRSLMLLHQNQICNHQQKTIYNVGTLSDNRFAQAISRLCDIYQEFDPNNPVFLKRLKHYILQTMERSNEDNTFNQHRHLIENAENSLRSLRQLAAILNISCLHRMTKADILITICQTVLFPADGTHSIIEEHSHLNLSENNEKLNKTLQVVSSVELRSNSWQHRRFYRSYDHLHVRIPKLEHLMQREVNNMTFIDRSISYSVPWLMLAMELYPNRLDNESQEVENTKSSIKHFLLSIEPICDKFITSEGENDPCFENCTKREQFLQMFPDLFDGDNFCPQKILPIVSLMARKSIVYYDLDASTTSLQYFDSSTNKIITYNLALSMPKIECICFGKKTHDNVARYRILQPEITTQPQDHNMNSQMASLTNRRNLQFIRKLKDHPYQFGNKKSKNIVKTLRSLLESPNVKHHHFSPLITDLKEDLLDIYPFLEELISSDQNIESMFNSAVLEDVSSVTEINEYNLQDLYQYVINESFMAQPSYYSVFVPIVCLKYKLWFCIWESTDEDTFSHFYWYDPDEEKVQKYSLPGYIYHKEFLQLLYVRIANKTVIPEGEKAILYTSFWHMPRCNVFNDSISYNAFNSHVILPCKYGYLDLLNANQLLASMKQEHSWDIVINLEFSSPLPNKKQMIPTPVYTENNKLSHIALLIIFPKDTASQCYTVLMFHRNVSPRLRKTIVTETMDHVLANNIDQYYESKEFDYSCLWSRSSCSSSSLVIFLCYISGLSVDMEMLQNVVSSLLDIPDLYSKIQNWIRDCLMDNKFLSPMHIPHWMFRIFPADVMSEYTENSV